LRRAVRPGGMEPFLASGGRQAPDLETPTKRPDEPAVFFTQRNQRAHVARETVLRTLASGGREAPDLETLTKRPD